MVQYPINPIYNAETKILLLGGFPSVKSGEAWKCIEKDSL